MTDESGKLAAASSSARTFASLDTPGAKKALAEHNLCAQTRPSADGRQRVAVILASQRGTDDYLVTYLDWSPDPAVHAAMLASKTSASELLLKRFE